MDASITLRLAQLSLPEACAETTKTSDSSSTDEVLLAQTAQGGREALALLFTRYARHVRGIAYRVLRNSAEADDLLQDVFLLISKLSGTFDPSKGAARFWILQIAYRRAISRRRYLTSRHFYQHVDIDHICDQIGDSRNLANRLDQAIDGELRAAMLQDVFNSLSHNQRQTLRLFFVEGFTFDEIAAQLGQSRGNIKHHYFRALERLRKHVIARQADDKTAVL